MVAMTQEGTYALGDWPLSGGGVLRDARLGYGIWGEPNAARDNFVVLPTFFSGAHADYAPLIGAGRALDPDRFCIVGLDLFGNAVSSSPSNAHSSQSGADFPAVSLVDSVRAQHRFLTEALGMRSVALAAGWSMGGMQSYHWAAAWPEIVKRILPWCAAARCAPQNRLFLHGLEAALTADAAFAGGHYAEPPERGVRAFARVYLPWVYSADFYRREGWRELGFDSLAALADAWEADQLSRFDANDLISKMRAWGEGDVASWADGDFRAAMGRVRAHAVLLPCRTDMLFTIEDNARDDALLPNAELRAVHSDRGHAAGRPGTDPVFDRALEEALGDLLEDYRQGEH